MTPPLPGRGDSAHERNFDEENKKNEVQLLSSPPSLNSFVSVDVDSEIEEGGEVPLTSVGQEVRRADVDKNNNEDEEGRMGVKFEVPVKKVK
jgi:hypothetical protein